MLIDLARNDIGRIAQVGSVKVTDQMVIEKYSHVQHIVSNVEGLLQPGLDAIDVLRASFPAGTLTGAPKVRAMEIIDELEPVKRGIYGGACGYYSWSGEMDVAIAIRTGVLKDGTLNVQAAAGVVYDSIPEAEYQETEVKARAVLRARFPEAEIYEDIRAVDTKELAKHGKVDVICGGFPCQDLSVAGKRAGLQGERSRLFYVAMRIVRELSPAILLLENVPGLLTSNQGHDFAAVLREVGEGWGCQEVAWRVLDSQYFGVPQRRRRVFIAGSRHGGCASRILALEDGGEGDPGACKAEGSPTPRDVRGFTPSQFANYREGVGTLRANGGDLGGGSETLIAESRMVSISAAGEKSRKCKKRVIRKLTPEECEKLQGFPEGWTAVCDAAQTTRYRQLGNAVTVNVAAWIARRTSASLR
jgi:site-specific DNA-cytosine methylase